MPNCKALEIEAKKMVKTKNTFVTIFCDLEKAFEVIYHFFSYKKNRV